MHIKTSSMLPTTLLSLLLSSLSMATAIADVSRCVRENASILAQAAACTNEVSVLQECFLSIPDIVTADDLRTCFIERGCTIAEAASEAAAILQSCDASALVSDLRRSDAEPGSETSPTPTPTPAATKDENDNNNNSNNNGSGSITTSGIVVAVVLSLSVVAGAALFLFYYLKERKKRRAQEDETRRKNDEVTAEAARRTFAQQQVARERERLQRIEASEWARRNRRGPSGGHPRYLPGDQNPFDDRSAAA